jgi:hypothetical protein
MKKLALVFLFSIIAGIALLVSAKSKQYSTLEIAENTIWGAQDGGYQSVRWKFPVAIFVQETCDKKLFTDVTSYIEKTFDRRLAVYSQSAENAEVLFACDDSGKVLTNFTRMYLDNTYRMFPDQISTLAESGNFPIFKFDQAHVAFGIPVYLPYECNFFLTGQSNASSCNLSLRSIKKFLFSANMEGLSSAEKFSVLLEEVSHALFLVNDYKVSNPRESIFNSNPVAGTYYYSDADILTIKFILSGKLTQVANREDFKAAFRAFLQEAQ